ncbi:MAG: hypothetical protein JWM19_990 [Actinomycetia bacterium]|nr:hypothetical protein [Actinomycetes bacterium]
MILQIDVTVTGPGGVMTGSAAVSVSQPPAQELGDAGDGSANEQMRQRSAEMRWGVSRA